jgi:hypothetical protein
MFSSPRSANIRKTKKITAYFLASLLVLTINISRYSSTASFPLLIQNLQSRCCNFVCSNRAVKMKRNTTFLEIMLELRMRKLMLPAILRKRGGTKKRRDHLSYKKQHDAVSHALEYFKQDQAGSKIHCVLYTNGF